MSTENGTQVAKEILDVKTATKILGCSVSHVSNILNGKVEDVPPIPYVRGGGLRLIRREALRRWFEDHCRYCDGRVTGSIPPAWYILPRCVVADVIDRLRRQGHQPMGRYCSLVCLGANIPRLCELDSSLTNSGIGVKPLPAPDTTHAATAGD